jgi:hypothetical protein
MKLQHLLILAILYFVSLQKIFGQEARGCDVEFIREANILFYEVGLGDTIHLSGVARVTFTDSVSLIPKNVDIPIMRMKGENGIKSINFSYFYSSDNDLSDCEQKMKMKYSAKIDSVFMNGVYQFLGEKKWIYGNQLDFSYSFEILSK